MSLTYALSLAPDYPALALPLAASAALLAGAAILGPFAWGRARP
jgi:hypothetical protein